VSVDEQRQITRGRGSFSDGRLVAFDDQWDVAQWMEAAGERAYPDLVETYRRGLLLVRVGETDAYVVDIFRVKGGSQHDWAIHGSADVDGTVNASVPTAAFGENLLPGVPVRFPAGERDRGDAGDRNLAYAYFQNVTRGTVDEGVVLSFGIDGEPAGLRTHLPGLSDGEVFLGDALSIRRADEDEALIDQYRMPIALLRRTGQAPLESVFVAVHEPFIGDTFIDSVNVRRVGDGGTEIVVKHGETTDHILLGEGDAGTVISFGPGEMIGDAGFVRERAGEVVQMALWGGTKLRWAGTEMTGSGILETAVEGTVRRAEGDESYGLIVEGPLPEGEEMKGAIAIIQFGDGTTRGCRVQEVRRTDDRYLVVLADDPGFSMTSDGAEHAFFPHRKMPGSVVCRIRSSAMLDVARGELHSVGGARYNRD
jgi:hypothetical protein